MVAYAVKHCFTPQEYLELERKAETRSEYDHGVIISMAGASWEHNLISSHTLQLLGNQLDGDFCEVVASDLRVRVPKCDKYYYPDNIVVCGEPQFEESGFDSLLNPKLLVEVLSESTEILDRKEKFDCYETLDSLTDYVLISQNEPRIEHFSRLEDGAWRRVVARGLEAVLNLPSIGCSLHLSDIYTRISFSAQPLEIPDNQVSK